MLPILPILFIPRNLLSEWCSSGADMKKPWMDST